MLIANIRSYQDLQSKKNLQQQLLELEVANEAESEKRQKDYKNPNKPVPIAPEYKTNAQLQSDRLAQEKQAITNMTELGFDYNKSAELVSWLSSSLINKLVEFNANFKGIKKELTETTNPKLINLDYLKNYLEKYFEDLDVNYGRKFSTQSINGTAPPTTIDDLTEMLPSIASLQSIVEVLNEDAGQQREYHSTAVRNLRLVEREIAVRTLSKEDERDLDERDRRDYKRGLKEMETQRRHYDGQVAETDDSLRKIRIAQALFKLYIAIIPTPETFALIKQSLTQQERADLIRRYIIVLRGLHILTRSGADELEDEIVSADSDEAKLRWLNKTLKALAFVSNDAGVNQITKLQRDYEIMLQQNGKLGDIDKIKRLNDIREAEINEARRALSSVYRDEEMGQRIRQDEGYEGTIELNVVGDRPIDEVLAEEQAERQAEYDLIRKYHEDNARYRQQRGEVVEDIIWGADPILGNQLNPVLPPPQREPTGNRRNTPEAQAYINMIKQYHANFINELDDLYAQSANSGISTARRFLIQYANKNEANTSAQKRNNLEWFNALKNMIRTYAQAKINFRTGANVMDYDFIDNAEHAIVYNQKQPTAHQTQYGIGLASQLKKHFKKDEKEMKMIKKAFKAHQKKDEDSSESDSESESGKKGGALGFRHKKIKVGGGISVRQQPSYKSFGKYVIHMGHLLDKNVANFKYPSLGSIPAIKPLTISEDYKEFLIDTLDNGKPNDRLLTKLPTEEQRHFERVVAGAGLIDTFKLKRNHTENEKKDAERFNLLRGEVLAGNNSEKVLKELRGLIMRFMNEGRIQQKEGTNMLLELSAF
jgi:hypothetical protein